MAGLVPAIHVFLGVDYENVDARDDPRIKSETGMTD
jgi:hypothetical protein